MFNLGVSLKVVVLALLLLTTSLSYKFYGEVKALEVQITELHEDLAASVKATALVTESCKITDEVVTQTNKEAIVAEVESDKLLDELHTLVITKVLTEKESPDKKVSEVVNETNKQSAGVHNANAGDVALQRLLDDAYCTAAKSDPYCSTR